MTAAALPASVLGWRTRLRRLIALTATEARLFLRDVPSAIFAVVLPAALLLGVGYGIPGMRETIPDGPWAGAQLIHAYAPAAFAMVIATPALSTLPVAVATYREQGVLRRLSTTPIRPQAVLAAQVAVNATALLVAYVLAVIACVVAFDLPAPRQPVTAALALALGTAATFGVGLLIAARARKTSVATTLGMVTYFPLLFFSGIWTPGPTMPEVVRTVAGYTPLGAASQALEAAWFSETFPARQVFVMAVFVGVLYPVAAKLFRWSS